MSASIDNASATRLFITPSRLAPPQLMKRLGRGSGHVADLRPSRGDGGHGFDPSAPARAAAEVPLLQRPDRVVQQRRAKPPSPQTIHRLLDRRPEMLRLDVAPEVDQVTGDVDLHRARFVTRSAKAACLRKVLEIPKPLEKRRDQRADGAGIDAAVRVPADLAIDRAGVQARAAADAAKRLAIFLAGE